MKRKNLTRNALFSSIISLLLCVSMLVGTTFAWFTDSVTSANNIIKSGNLDIELEYWTGTEWADVEGKSDILTNELWEPGVTEIAYLRVANAGSLALKYQLGINIVSETAGVNQAGKSFNLSEYINFGVVEGINGENGAYKTREDAVADLTDAKALNAGYTKASSMTAGQELYLALVVYMPTTVGNEANHNGTNVPEINLGISVFATQQMSENDSFGPDYDKGAAWTGLVDIDWYLDAPDATEYVLTSAEELAGLAAIVNGTAVAPVATYAAGEATTIKDNFKGKTIKLGANIDLHDVEWTPIGDNPNPFLGNFDGQGYTVSNLYVNNEGWSGLIGHAGKSAGCTIKNVTIDGATIFSNRMAGAVVGQLYGSIDNCHVKDATIIVIPNAVGDSYDNGDKVGGIVGWLGDNGNNRMLSNCSAENVEVGAYRDVGGIAGYVASSTTVKGNSVKGVEITVDQTTNYYGDKDVNAGLFYGRAGGAITESDNAADTASSIDATYSKNGLTMKADGKGNVVLYLVPETYTGATVNVPEGVTAIGNYAFAYNTNVKTVTLSSTVKSLGRGFDTSAVEKVVLNEGLEKIDSRAFRSTANLKEVVIPSSVKEIEDNAFQKSGIKNIVIPATVKTIGETAFGASKIETVIFEGNTSIQGFAFRGCPNLRTVYLYGDDVTFIASTLNGRNSIWFCNGESNNPNTSKITFCVTNDTVKERVLTAMGAERDNTTVKTLVTATTLAEVMAAAKNGNVIIDAQGANLGDFNYDGTFGNGTVLKNAKFTYVYGASVQGTVTFENCEFVSDHSYSANFSDGSYTGNIIFNNCLFDGWSSFGTAITGVEMNNCTFQKSYNYGILRFYQNAELNNCTFADSFEGIDTNVTDTVVNINNCTGVEGKIFNNGDNVGTWIVDDVDISANVTSW